MPCYKYILIDIPYYIILTLTQLDKYLTGMFVPQDAVKDDDKVGCLRRQTMTTTAATNGNKNNKTLLRTTKAHLDPATKLWNILQQKTEIESKVGVWGIMRRA